MASPFTDSSYVITHFPSVSVKFSAFATMVVIAAITMATRVVICLFIRQYILLVFYKRGYFVQKYKKRESFFSKFLETKLFLWKFIHYEIFHHCNIIFFRFSVFVGSGAEGCDGLFAL